ncbi:hypothetical protein NDU88_009530 [Pleurodeles waltl]|uniref:Uncharacterized protein n=1 Tax=Pleurodeles waltl TaxID=8319 RepID=A0AAV7QRW9_PLEWA|nr:hypothetical protein NDU88_009530 [Pleurodeles waltl]
MFGGPGDHRAGDSLGPARAWRVRRLGALATRSSPTDGGRVWRPLRLGATGGRVPVEAVGRGGSGSGGTTQKGDTWPRPFETEGGRLTPKGQEWDPQRVVERATEFPCPPPRSPRCEGPAKCGVERGPSARWDNWPMGRVARHRPRRILLDGAGPWWSPVTESALLLRPGGEEEGERMFFLGRNECRGGERAAPVRGADSVRTGLLGSRADSDWCWAGPVPAGELNSDGVL